MTAHPSLHVEVVPLDDLDARAAFDELSTHLAERYGNSGRDGFDPDAEDPETVVVVARSGGDVVGCGAVRPKIGRASCRERA